MSHGQKKHVSQQQWITQLNPADVLFGRGSGPNDHEGNVIFRSMVADRKAEYLATTHRQTKAKIAREIVTDVWNRGGRFLKRVDGGVDAWCVVDEDTTMEKAKQALRQNREKTATTTTTATETAKPPATKTAPVKSSPVAATAAPPTASGNFALPGAGGQGAATTGLQRPKTQQHRPQPSGSSRVVSAPPDLGVAAASSTPAYAAPPAATASAPQPVVDPFEPIPVEQMTASNTRIPSGLEVWADFVATNPPGSLSSSGEQIQRLQREKSERERRESLQIADLVRSDPLQQGGFFGDDSRKSSTEMEDLVDGVLRLSTRTMEGGEDSSTTMGTIERPIGVYAHRGSSITSMSTKASHMSGISMDGSDSSLFDVVRTVAASDRDSSDSIAAAVAASTTTGPRRSSAKNDVSFTMSEIWRRESLLGQAGNTVSPKEAIIQEGDEEQSNETLDVDPRRLSQLEDEPDILDYLGSSSMSVIKTAMARSSGDSGLSFTTKGASIPDFIDSHNNDGGIADK